MQTCKMFLAVLLVTFIGSSMAMNNDDALRKIIKRYPDKLAKIVNNEELSKEDAVIAKEIVDAQPFHWNGCTLWTKKKTRSTEFSSNSSFSKVLPSGNIIVLTTHFGKEDDDRYTYAILPVDKFKKLYEKTLKVEQMLKEEFKKEFIEEIKSKL